MDNGEDNVTVESAVTFAVSNDIPVMFVTEDTRSNPEDNKKVYTRAIELGR